MHKKFKNCSLVGKENVAPADVLLSSAVELETASEPVVEVAECDTTSPDDPVDEGHGGQISHGEEGEAVGVHNMHLATLPTVHQAPPPPQTQEETCEEWETFDP